MTIAPGTPPRPWRCWAPEETAPWFVTSRRTICLVRLRRLAVVGVMALVGGCSDGSSSTTGAVSPSTNSAPVTTAPITTTTTSSTTTTIYLSPGAPELLMECGDRAARPWQSTPADVYADCRWRSTTNPPWAVATWQFDPATYPDPADSTVVVLAQDMGWSGCSLPADRGSEVRPIVRIAGDDIVILILVEASGYFECSPGPLLLFAVSVDLGAPLGDRRLFDGWLVPPLLRFPPPPPHPRFSGSVGVPAGVVDVVAGYESLWVAGFGAVTRLNPENHEIVATIETPGTDDFTRLAVGYGSVWVTANDGMVYRIDPATNRVIAAIDVGDDAFGVAVGGGSVWITEPGEVGELIRVDAVTNEVVGDPIEVGPGPFPVVFDAGYAWVSNTSPPSLVRVDSVTGGVETIGSGGRLLVAEGSLWAATGDEVIRIDPESGQALAHIPIPRAGVLAAGDEAIWVLAWADDTGSPSAALWMINPATNHVVGEAVGVDSPQPIAIAVTDGAVWVADYTGMSLSRFDLVP